MGKESAFYYISLLYLHQVVQLLGCSQSANKLGEQAWGCTCQQGLQMMLEY